MKLDWKPGRQGPGYLKALLGQGKTWDLYLIKYEAGSHIRPHTDPVSPGKRHWRANLLLRGEDNFVGASKIRILRLVIFRPDITTHWVDELSKPRLVLSLGWVTE